MPEYKISYTQLIKLVVVIWVVTEISYAPALNSTSAGRDIWISVIFSFPIMFLFIIPLYILWKRYPNQNIIQYSTVILGKVGILVGILYIIFFLHMIALTLDELGYFLTSTLYPETPQFFFVVTFIVFCTYAATKGVETLGRFSEIIFSLLFIIIVFVFLLLITNIKLNEFLPVMEKGIFPPLQGGLSLAANSVDIAAMAFLLPHIDDPGKAKKTLALAGLYIVILLILITAPIVGVFGSTQARNLTFPLFYSLRTINIAESLQRIETLHAGIWLFITYIKVSLYYYICVKGISQLFGTKGYKHFILPAGMVIISLYMLITGSIIGLREFISVKELPYYSLFFILAIPTLLLIVSLIRKRRGKKA